MQLHRKIHLYNLLVNAVAAILIYLAGIYIIGAWLSTVLESEKLAISESIEKDIAILDELLISIEKKWDKELAIVLPIIADELQNVSTLSRAQLNSRLLGLKKKYQVSDIHLINPSLQVFASTFEKDIGLDLTKYSQEYTAYLQSLLGTGQYSSHRLTLSENNERLKKFAYYSAPGSNLLINADIDVKTRLSDDELDSLANYIFGQYLEKLKSKYQIIDDINLVMLSQTNHWSMFSDTASLDSTTARKLYDGEVSAENTNNIEFLEASLLAYDELGFKPVVQIEYINNPHQGLKNQLQFILLCIVIAVGVISYYLLCFGTRKVFLDRFNNLHAQIKQKRSGDKKRISIDGNDELSMLALSVDKLMLRMEEQRTQNQNLYTDSTTDSLTKVANRRFFDEQFSIEWKQAQRIKGQLSLIMLDIDYFKNFNDHYGHVAGDIVLQKIANVMATSLTRPRDFVARFGGEEFICVLPNTDLLGAKKVAEQICSGIAALKIEHKAAGHDSVVTASLGCLNVLGSLEVKPQKILKEVDELMYQAKTSGKNKVCAKQLFY